MNTWPAPGIHEGVPFPVYRSDDITNRDTIETVQGKATSKSTITDFLADPWQWRNRPAKETTAAMGFGSLVDTLLLEPTKFESRYALSPYSDFRKKEAQEWRDAMSSAGVEVITEDTMARAHDTVEAIRRNTIAAGLLDGARTQVAFRHPTRFGFDSKGLIDIVPQDETALVDLKTCSASALEDKRSLQRHLFEYGYHIQAGAYCDGWAAAGGEERTRFLFIFVASTPPHRVAVIELPYAAISYGASQYAAGLAQFAQCLERNHWPSIWDGLVELDLPQYAYLDEE